MDNQKAELEQAQELEFYREEARRDFLFYVQACDEKYIFSKVHELIAKKLQAVAEGKIKRLIINVPPRIGKTRLCAIEFPTWLLGKRPDMKVVLAGYGQHFVNESSIAARNRMEHETYKTLFDTRLQEGRKSVEVWGTKEGGTYRAVGVGGALTGVGSDCLVTGTLITTDQGEIPIEQLAMTGSPANVLSYDTKRKEVVFKKIKAVANRNATGFYRITTASGRVVEATGEHPFFVGGEWVNASKLAPGDNLLLALREAENNTSIRHEEGGKEKLHKEFLQQDVLVGPRVRKMSQQEADVPKRRMSKPREERFILLLLGMCKSDGLFKGRSSAEKQTISGVSFLRKNVSEKSTTPCSSSLFSKVRGWNPRIKNDWQRKSVLEKRNVPTEAAATLCKDIQDSTSRNNSARLRRMYSLRLKEVSARSPHKHESIRQQMEESGDALQKTSHTFSCRGAFKTESDTVVLAEYIRQSTVVWNIQVEGTENFFANEILTHNCLILDDTTKDYVEANSKVTQEMVWNWFWSVAMTRLSPGAPVIIIMTRWSMGDLVGRLTDPKQMAKMNDNQIFNPEDKWDVINLPALAKANDLLGRKEGESIFPEKYTEKMLQGMKATSLPYVWSALYDGDPQQAGGNYIPIDKFIIEEAAPEGLRWVRGWDLATSTKTINDATAGIAAAVSPDGHLWLKDMHHWRLNWPESRNKIKVIAESERYHMGVEAVAGFKTAYQNLLEVLPSFVMCSEVGADKDKLTRAMPWIAMVARGAVHLVRGPWVAEFLIECERFTGKDADEDDRIDAVSIAYFLIANSTPHAIPLKNQDKFAKALAQRRKRELDG